MMPLSFTFMPLTTFINFTLENLFWFVLEKLTVLWSNAQVPMISYHYLARFHNRKGSPLIKFCFQIFIWYFLFALSFFRRYYEVITIGTLILVHRDSHSVFSMGSCLLFMLWCCFELPYYHYFIASILQFSNYFWVMDLFLWIGDKAE